ncbi:hypothetical protein [Crocosphaera chwakensis]|uniref:Uncharacterized protein n=1 Tax=Crocosphaera chwakensis CCY0110 TaxID=391612 RepID=A3IS53_9CHRO|nr:hypothetical protein [Crocosphaera chwakensis]EAZ90731.1 hypothetical protein CY0110_32325 [Crocosphaera chwakensis CCY0110]
MNYQERLQKIITELENDVRCDRMGKRPLHFAIALKDVIERRADFAVLTYLPKEFNLVNGFSLAETILFVRNYYGEMSSHFALKTRFRDWKWLFSLRFDVMSYGFIRDTVWSSIIALIIDDDRFTFSDLEKGLLRVSVQCDDSDTNFSINS